MNEVIIIAIVLLAAYFAFKVARKLLVIGIQSSYKILFRKRIQEMEQQVKKNNLFLKRLQEECNRD